MGIELWAPARVTEIAAARFAYCSAAAKSDPASISAAQAPQNVSPAPLTDKAYMINVANSQYGVGYGEWTSIDGWSESIIDYIREFEMLTD